MGCSASSSVYDKHPELSKWSDQFHALQLSNSDVKQLYKEFKNIDISSGRTIELLELLVYMNMDKTSFSERVFLLFDTDNSGEIDFCEFVVTLWNYCTLGRDNFGIFAFDVYDSNENGVLSRDDIHRMLHDLYPSQSVLHNHAKNVEKELMEMAQNDRLTVQQFKQFAVNHQALLFPAFHMQSEMQKNICGVSFWKRQHDNRARMSKGRYLPIGHFIVESGLKSAIQRKPNHLLPCDDDGDDDDDGSHKDAKNRNKHEDGHAGGNKSHVNSKPERKNKHPDKHRHVAHSASLDDHPHKKHARRKSRDVLPENDAEHHQQQKAQSLDSYQRDKRHKHAHAVPEDQYVDSAVKHKPSDDHAHSRHKSFGSVSTDTEDNTYSPHLPPDLRAVHKINDKIH